MSSYCLDVESFISEVKKYPEIWDINCDGHRFKSKKQNAWAEIARVFISDFEEIPDKERIGVCKYDNTFHEHNKHTNQAVYIFISSSRSVTNNK